MQKDVGIRLKITTNPKGYTNGKVEITIEAKTNGDTVTNLIVSDGMTKKEDGKYEIEKNGTYKITATLSSGKILEKEIEIATIDKIAPKDFEITGTYEGGSLKIEAQTQDAEATEESVQSGIEKYEYYVNNEEKYESNVITGLAGSTYTVYVIAYDKAGNNTKSNEITLTKQIKIKEVSAGDYHSLAIDEDGNLWAWGYNNKGQLGDGTTTNRTNPVQIKAGIKFKKVCASSDYRSFAIDEDGNLWAWGCNEYGQLGDGTTTNSNVPVQVKNVSNVIQVSAGKNHTLALTETGEVWGWGYNSARCLRK